MTKLVSKGEGGIAWTGERTAEQRELDLQDISRLYLQAWTQVDIASWLTERRPYVVNGMMVSRGLSELRVRWLQSQLVDFDTAKARELEKVDRLERAYWEGWDRSKAVMEEEQVESIRDENSGLVSEGPEEKWVKGKEGKDEEFEARIDDLEAQMTGNKGSVGGVGRRHVFTREKKIVKRKEMVGAAVFLQGIGHCIEMRCMIMGLNAPTTLNINWKKDAKEMGLDAEAMKKELVDQMVAKAKGAIRDGKDLSMIIPKDDDVQDAEYRDMGSSGEQA